MKVLMINGSPHVKGTTMRALQEVEKELNSNGIDTEIITVGNLRVSGCIGCRGCAVTGRCVENDIVNQLIDKISNSDGLIIGSPVYYASINGVLKGILDRVFYAQKNFAHKPAAGVVVARRAGTTASLDIINKYFMLSNMPIVSSNYWNMVHGNSGDDAESDIEGLQTMRMLGKNMAWLLKSIDVAKNNGVYPPEVEKKVKTNFVR